MVVMVEVVRVAAMVVVARAVVLVAEATVGEVMVAETAAEVMVEAGKEVATEVAVMAAETAARRSPRRRSTAQRASRSSHHIDSPPHMSQTQRRASLVWSMRAHRCTASHRLLTDPQTERSCTAGSSWSSD